jgi:hypothetical protein
MDGTTCAFSARTIGEAIERATDHAQTIGRVLIEVDVDGRTLDADDLDEADSLGVSPEEIAFTSLSPEELLLATLDLGEQAIESAQVSFKQAAELIQSGDTDRAFGELKQGIDLWKTVEETVFREAIPEVPGHEKALEERIAELRHSFDSIKRAIATSDLAALSDALLYEFPQTSSECASLLKECSETVTKGMKDDLESNA